MLQKGYARKAENEQVGKVCYIAHHGVTHPDKARKVRVVSDCCAEFGGTSHIKRLIAESDWTNQLIGVLARFREEHITYMADIESSSKKCLCRWYAKVVLRCWDSNRSDFQSKRFMCCWRFMCCLSAIMLRWWKLFLMDMSESMSIWNSCRNLKAKVKIHWVRCGTQILIQNFNYWI